MKWVKGLLWVCALLVLFVISALVGIALYVDPNDYKPRIEELVETHTGRDFEIAGEIDLSLFPWLGLELSGVTLSNLQGFSEPHFAQVERVNIKVALLPLFRLQTRVGVLQLKGLNVNLETRADGVTNWESLGAAADIPDEVPAEIPAGAPVATIIDGEAAEGSSAVDTALANLYIGGIDIEEANITWRDASSDTLTKIQHFNFHTGAIRLNHPVDFNMSLSLRNENPKIIAGVELTATVNANLAAESYEIKNIKLKTRASGAAIPGNEQTLELSIESVLADLKTETASVQNLLAQVGGMKAGLNVSANDILGETLGVSGRINLETDSLQRLLAALAVPMPMTADNAVFGKFRLDSNFTAGLDAVALQDMTMSFDESTLSGQLSAKNFDKPVLVVDLSLDRINADRYLPPSMDEAEAPVLPVGDEEADPEIDLPVEDLRNLDIDGRLRIGALQIMNMKVANIEVNLKGKEGVINLKPLNLDLYQGQFRGEAGIDVREDIPAYSADLKLAGVHFGSLLDDFMEDGFVEGVANMNAAINTKGDRVSVLKQGLQGQFDFGIENGALKGVNIGEKLREVRAKLQRESYTPLSTAKKTDFAEMEGGGDIKDGVVSLRKIDVASPLLRADIKGKADLVNELLDVYVNAYLVGTTTGQDGRELDEVRRIHAPIMVKGKFDAPDIKVDWNAMLKSDTLDELSAKKDAAQARLDQQRKAAQDALAKEQAELKRQEDAKKAELEAKRKAEEDELKKRLEEKKKEKLKDLLR